MPKNGIRRAPRITAGFTLLELLLVVVIAGIALGAISLSAMGSEKRAVHDNAQRIALLLSAAHDEAIMRNHPIAFEAAPDRYRFLIHEDDGWQLLAQDGPLRERGLGGDMHLALTSSSGELPLRIVFGREPVAAPFALTLNDGATSAVIHADGVGHFSVE